MSRCLKLMIALLLVFVSLPVLPAVAQTDSLCDIYGTHGNGAKYCINMPTAGTWNGGLVIFAHGYVPVTEPVDIAWTQMYLVDGTYIPDLVNSMGFAFATTSYSVNGLAVERGKIDILDLVEVFKMKVGEPTRSYLVGASEGGLITTLMIEEQPGVFDGGMALCGPIGDFNEQLNYWGNFRVAFDYYLPGVLRPSAISIPDDVIGTWNGFYVPMIGQALYYAAPETVANLISVSGAAIDPANQNLSTLSTVQGILWYNAFATNNGNIVLRGQPFDNSNYLYADPDLNLAAPRYTADKSALNNIEHKYETSGRLKKPLVTIHTTLDPIVPYWHTSLYAAKVLENNKGAAYLNIPVERYGHCNFTPQDLLSGFYWLLAQPVK